MMADTSNHIPAVYGAIAAVMGDLAKEGISKDRKATGVATYNFRGIDDVYNALAMLLSKHGLVILPRVLSREQTERTTKSGGTIVYTVVEVEYDIVSAKDGSSHIVRTIGEAMDTSDKSTNKAMSAAYKYMAFQAFCIPTEGDNDADATSEHLPPKQSQPPARQQQNRQQAETPFDEPRDRKPVDFWDRPSLTLPVKSAEEFVEKFSAGLSKAPSEMALTKFLADNETHLKAISEEQYKTCFMAYERRLAGMARRAA